MVNEAFAPKPETECPETEQIPASEKDGRIEE
jgi:hypothetical protein